jgi:superfamily II DNA or RNA helicase
MARLEDLAAGASVRGLVPEGLVSVVAVQWFGDQALEVIYKDSGGKLGTRLVYRAEEPTLEIAEVGRPWSFDGDGHLFRLVAEAYRIRLAYLFDPYLAVQTSLVEPLPHQITAVYSEMLPRQPLRFLLADDPGAGKTIMAGLLVKELMVRGDLRRCLVVSPGNLTEQWQDELWEKFGLKFDLLTRDRIEGSRTGNPFDETDLLIARLDMVSRNEDLQARLHASRDWDLVVCDEAHKMSGTFFGGEVKLTKRYKLGQLLGGKCRHLLLMTATPHNGKEEEFQLFMALLDGDRFEGRFRDGVHKADTSDMMRRMVKEELLRFDGTPLFPERRAYTVNYKLSDAEAALYHEVTRYVNDEMNRAERFADAEHQQRLNVGFALMILQRRLASSPEAIYQSLRRRRERLEKRLAEEKIAQRGAEALLSEEKLDLGDDLWDDMDDAPQEEVEKTEEQVLDRATTARTIEELKKEIDRLRDLEERAKQLRNSKTDSKWVQLDGILGDPLVASLDAEGARRKLIIFTESRDTLKYLADRIRTRLGKPESVVIIHGGISREDRKKTVEAFKNDKDVLVLVANDAAGEGVNLQRAHLMVNYDLPWNPNRLEQRFGRIHRIGQREVCHLWNMVANETREGQVFERLLKKIEVEREALGGRVYDVLGRLFEEQPLRDLLMEAIRYGDQPEVKARLDKAVDNAADRQRLIALMEDEALAHETMDASRVQTIREEMERAAARRLQPHFIQSFFLEAFGHLGGKYHRREPGRFEVTHVPGPLRDRDRQIGQGEVLLSKYERITFEKELVNQTPVAAFVSPSHPLLDATIDLTIERHRDLLKRGAVLVDENDTGIEVRALFFLEHSVQDGRPGPGGTFQVISQRLQFVEVDATGIFKGAGHAPYLDYRPATEEEKKAAHAELQAPWLRQELEHRALGFAITSVVPGHVEEVRARRMRLVDKVEEAVKARLKKEINFWDHRAEELKAQERAGKNTRLSSSMATARAEELASRLQQRLDALKRERQISAQPPVAKGGAIILPIGLLRRLGAAPKVHEGEVERQALGLDKDTVERLAMEAAMAAERALGREPRDVSDQRGLGYDIESRDPAAGHLYFIEVKGREEGASSVSLTKNEILCARNQPERFRLAIVLVDREGAKPPVYVRDYDFGQPGFEQTSATFPLLPLLSRGERAV